MPVREKKTELSPPPHDIAVFSTPMGEEEPEMVIAGPLTGLHNQTSFHGVEELRLNWRSQAVVEKDTRSPKTVF